MTAFSAAWSACLVESLCSHHPVAGLKTPGSSGGRNWAKSCSCRGYLMTLKYLSCWCHCPSHGTHRFPMFCTLVSFFKHVQIRSEASLMYLAKTCPSPKQHCHLPDQKEKRIRQEVTTFWINLPRSLTLHIICLRSWTCFEIFGPTATLCDSTRAADFASTCVFIIAAIASLASLRNFSWKVPRGPSSEYSMVRFLASLQGNRLGRHMSLFQITGQDNPTW